MPEHKSLDNLKPRRYVQICLENKKSLIMVDAVRDKGY
jgi:hypothetical protein